MVVLLVEHGEKVFEAVGERGGKLSRSTGSGRTNRGRASIAPELVLLLKLLMLELIMMMLLVLLLLEVLWRLLLTLLFLLLLLLLLMLPNAPTAATVHDGHLLE